MLRAIASAAVSGRVSEATWGVTVTRGCAQNGWRGGSGSSRKTSRVAWVEAALVERGEERGVVDQAAAAGVDQPGARRQQGSIRRTGSAGLGEPQGLPLGRRLAVGRLCGLPPAEAGFAR